MSRPGVGRVLAALLILAVSFVTLSQAAPAVAGDAPDACALPDDLRGFPSGLDRIRAKLASGAGATILAIGSSSTEGIGASNVDHTYPSRLAVHLASRLPGAAIRVVNRGIGGEVVATTAARLRTEVDTVLPDLVIWQVGTNDAVRGVGLDAMARTVDEGLDWLAARGIDVVLMDPQFYPRIADNAGYRQAVAVVGDLATRHGVALVRRYEAMSYWAARPTPVAMLSGDAFHMNDQGYDCVAGMIAGGIAGRLAAGPAEAPAATQAALPAAAAPKDDAAKAQTASNPAPALVTPAPAPAARATSVKTLGAAAVQKASATTAAALPSATAAVVQ